VSQKKSLKNHSCTDVNSFWWKCCVMSACHLENTLLEMLLFEGICHSNSKNESISLQRAMLEAGLQNGTPATSRAWSLYEMS
jgi:hypothetical protein